MRGNVFGVVWGVLFLTAGCSGLLYYPSQTLYSNPQKSGLDVQNLKLPLKDGETTVHAWLLKLPETKSPKGVVLFFHGNAENLSSHYLNSVFLVKAGYEVLIFDYPGYGLSTGDSDPEVTVEAGAVFLKWLAENRPKLPWVIIGQSIGGAIAMRTVAEASKDLPIKLVVIDSSFLSYQKIGRKTLGRVWLTWPFQWIAWLVLSDRWAPESVLSDISPRPLLVIHGTMDQAIPLEFGEEIFEKAGQPKLFWRIEGGEHIDSFRREKGRYQKELLDLIDSKIRGAE